MTAGALTSLLRLLFLLSGDRGIKMHEKFFNKLNDEQKDIVKLVKQGLTNIEIGVELHKKTFECNLQKIWGEKENRID